MNNPIASATNPRGLALELLAWILQGFANLTGTQIVGFAIHHVPRGEHHFHRIIDIVGADDAVRMETLFMLNTHWDEEAIDDLKGYAGPSYKCGFAWGARYAELLHSLDG